MTAAPAPPRPLPGCPARHGDGADLAAAGFTLVARDYGHGPDGHDAMTEVFGYYHVPGDDDGDVVQADGFDVPAASPAARLARQAAASPAATAAVAAVLRARVAACPCTPAAGCPALDDVSLAIAIGQATTPPGSPPGCPGRAARRDRRCPAARA